MSVLYPPWSNTVLWVALVGGAAMVCAVVSLPMIWVRTPYVTGQQHQIDQPLKFDHRHHNRDDGIDCMYCHGDAARSPYAGVPATSRCMGCHAQVWTGTPELAPVRASFFEDRPIPWQRVNSVPDFVFFDHSIHVTKGIGCVECHGRVDLMSEVYQEKPLTMHWCLDCHRDPVPHVRPPDRVTDMTFEAPLAERAKVAKDLGVRSLTSCSTCHR